MSPDPFSSTRANGTFAALSPARNDGAAAFATLKSILRTCQKNGLNFLEYGLSVLRAQAADCPPPLPLDSG